MLADEEEDCTIDDSPDEGEIQFRVMGEPIPQGSVRAFITKSGRPIITHSNRNMKEWRQRIATEGQAKRPPQWDMESAILMNIDFFMPRPKSLPKKVEEDVKRPDLDKLVRAVLDSLTSIFYNDDSQVVGIFASKKYAGKNVAPGCEIRLHLRPVRGED